MGARKRGPRCPHPGARGCGWGVEAAWQAGAGSPYLAASIAGVLFCLDSLLRQRSCRFPFPYLTLRIYYHCTSTTCRCTARAHFSCPHCCLLSLPLLSLRFSHSSSNPFFVNLVAVPQVESSSLLPALVSCIVVMRYSLVCKILLSITSPLYTFVFLTTWRGPGHGCMVEFLSACSHILGEDRTGHDRL